jgi:hypothetical protein
MVSSALLMQNIRSSERTPLGPVILGKRTHHLRVLDCVSRQHLTLNPVAMGTHE